MIDLKPEHKKFLDELMGYISNMEACMKTEIDHSDINSLTYQLTKAISLLSTQGRAMELAASMFDWAKGQAVEIVKNEDYKQDLMRLKLSGLLSVHSARFDRAERTVKALTTYIEGLRTLISAEKTLSHNIGS